MDYDISVRVRAMAFNGLIVINSWNVRWKIIPVFDGPYKEAVFPLIAS
jgi:hypothetical protein